MSLTEGLEHIVRSDEPLAPMTSLRIGGNAAHFAEPTCTDELLELIKRFSTAGEPIHLIGAGSNLLIPDDGVKGLVINLSGPSFGQINVVGQKITAGGGTKMAHLIATSVREGLAGLHRLIGIPGTVGGALNGNAGIQGFDIGSLVSEVKVITRDGELITRDKDSMVFSHRSSSLNELVVLEATFELESKPAEALTKDMQQKWIVMRAGQPFSNERSAYLFKDHGGETAAEVIERAGLKGTALGPVALSDRNSNFMVASESATAEDVKKFIQHIEDQVAVKIDIDLETAIQIW
jgi:UDP-N-acetylmuramate dehydrogenase